MKSGKPARLVGDLALDLGTANTRIYVKGEGVVLDEPSVVAVTWSRGRMRVREVGRQAAQMIGRAPDGLEVIQPIRSGIVEHPEAASAMIRQFLAMARGKKSGARPKVLMSIPSGSTPVERRLANEAAASAGARRVTLVDSCLAAGLGAGVAVDDAGPVMVVDIGRGTTDVAVLALGGALYARSVDVGGAAMDSAICDYVRAHHNVLIGGVTAEQVKFEIGSAYFADPGNGRSVALRGQDLGRGVPREFVFNEAETAESLKETVGSIYEGIRFALDRTQVEFGPAIAERGILLTGGGALTHNLDAVIATATGLTVTMAPDPLVCVAAGMGVALESRARFPARPGD